MSRKFKIVRAYVRSEAGSVIPVAAMAFPLIIGMAGVGVDISSWMMDRRVLQTAADAGALAGAWALANGGTTPDAEAAVLREAEQNGYDPALGTLEIAVTVDDDDGMRTVTVDVREPTNVWFSSMFLNQGVYVATTAAAIEVEGGGFCVLGLDQTAIGAVEASGSVVLDMPNCGVAVNSESSSALSLSGNVTLNVGDVRIVGDYAEGGSVDFTYKTMRTNSNPTIDPYADLEVPAFTACTSKQQKAGPTKYTGDATLNPGTYCGGITITGNNTITLNSGTYIMDGGSFNVSGGGSITGVGVTIILTNSGESSYGTYGNIDMSGGKEILLSAPTSGDFAGVAVYQDRNTPAGSGSNYNKITGTVGVEIEGVVYTPARQLAFGGNGKVSASGDPLCTKLVGLQVMFNGNPAIGSDCTGSATEDIGPATARLVL